MPDDRFEMRENNRDSFSFRENKADEVRFAEIARGKQGPPGPPGTTDYNDLTNKPKLNNVTIEGEHDGAYYGLDRTYIHSQDAAAATWLIVHNLKKYPSVTVVDSGLSQVLGAVTYIDENQLTVEFSAPFSGTAYLN